MNNSLHTKNASKHRSTNSNWLNRTAIFTDAWIPLRTVFQFFRSNGSCLALLRTVLMVPKLKWKNWTSLHFRIGTMSLWNKTQRKLKENASRRLLKLWLKINPIETRHAAKLRFKPISFRFDTENSMVTTVADLLYHFQIANDARCVQHVKVEVALTLSPLVIPIEFRFADCTKRTNSLSDSVSSTDRLASRICLCGISIENGNACAGTNHRQYLKLIQSVELE